MTESATHRSTDPCPMCGSRSAGVVARIPYADIWAALEAQLGVSAEAKLRRTLTPGTNAELFQCPRCRLEFFSPHNQGGPDFYSFLGSGRRYYEDQRWEYDRTAAIVGPHDSLLDVGCGDGSFLRRIAPSVGRAVGVDQNPDGIRQLAAANVEAYCMDLAEFAHANEPPFDVVCAFQVIEHIPQLTDFAAAIRRCVAPGGVLVASVPNNDRVRLATLDPLDCPPHHVSRWRPAQLRELAHLLEFEVVAIWLQRRRPRALKKLLPTARDRLGRRRSPAHQNPREGHATHEAASTRLPAMRRFANLTLDHTMALVARRPS